MPDLDSIRKTLVLLFQEHLELKAQVKVILKLLERAGVSRVDIEHELRKELQGLMRVVERAEDEQLNVELRRLYKQFEGNDHSRQLSKDETTKVSCITDHQSKPLNKEALEQKLKEYRLQNRFQEVKVLARQRLRKRAQVDSKPPKSDTET